MAHCPNAPAALNAGRGRDKSQWRCARAVLTSCVCNLQTVLLGRAQQGKHDTGPKLRLATVQTVPEVMAHTETNGVDGFYDDNQNIEDASLEKQVLYYKKRLEDLQLEFDEYQQSSSELETELETQLSNNEKRIRDLEAKNRQLNNENELLRTRFERISTESRSQLTDLQCKYEKVSTENEQLKSYIRDLEQSNDDLDRAKRTLDATLSEFDGKLNEQIERNELLESEIGEKEQLQVVIQRLKDEARDLRLELMIQQSSKSKKSVVGESESTNSSPTGNRHQQRTTATNNVHNNSVSLTNGSTTPENNKTPYNSSSGNNPSSPNYNNTPKQSPNLLSASSRISALNIVSDLLRKVGALESKLASCRSIVPMSGSLMNSKASANSIRGSTTNNNVDTNSSINSSPKDINANV